jgi:hypothetical protein
MESSDGMEDAMSSTRDLTRRPTTSLLGAGRYFHALSCPQVWTEKHPEAAGCGSNDNMFDPNQFFCQVDVGSIGICMPAYPNGFMNLQWCCSWRVVIIP